MHPNFQVLFFFIIPICVKWIAWLAWAQIIWTFFPIPLIWKVAVLLSLSNYFLFLGSLHVQQVRDLILYFRQKQRRKDWPTS